MAHFFRNNFVLLLSFSIANISSISDTLQRTNVTMRQQFSLVNNWHNNVKALKEQHEVELKKSKNINDEVYLHI